MRGRWQQKTTLILVKKCQLALQKCSRHEFTKTQMGCRRGWGWRVSCFRSNLHATHHPLKTIVNEYHTAFFAQTRECIMEMCCINVPKFVSATQCLSVLNGGYMSTYVPHLWEVRYVILHDQFLHQLSDKGDSSAAVVFEDVTSRQATKILEPEEQGRAFMPTWNILTQTSALVVRIKDLIPSVLFKSGRRSRTCRTR